MTKKIRPYHFTKNIGKNFIGYFDKIVLCNGIVCFDFEDSIGSFSKNQISSIKNTHRKLIIDGLIDLSSEIKLSHIGFRINGTETQNYYTDIEDICRLGSVNCVFLPKVENYNQILKLLNDF
jgi:citrate lyase beta subunit